MRVYLRAASAPNAVEMKELRQRKMALRESEEAAGISDKDRYKKVSSAASCTNGKAGGDSCNNINLLGFLRHQDLGSRTREGNKIWGIFLRTKMPVFRGVCKSPVRSINHNQYIIGGVSYQANYGSGLHMVNVTSLAQDDTGAQMKEIAFFEVHPEDDEVGGEAECYGAWSVYPYFQSGSIVVSSIERGIFSLRYTG